MTSPFALAIAWLRARLLPHAVAWLAFMLALFLALFLASSTFAADKPEEATAESPLRVANRTVYVFRAPMFGLTAAQRARRAAERIDAVPSSRWRSPVTAADVTQDGIHGYVLALEGETMFSVFPGDLEPGDPPLQRVANTAATRLQDALGVRWTQGSASRLLRSIGWTLLASAVLVGVIFLLNLAARVVRQRTARLRAMTATRRMLDLRRIMVAALVRVIQGVRIALLLFMLYVWLAFVLTRFPYTEPWGHTLGDSLRSAAERLVLSILHAMPDLAMVAMIFVLARVSVKTLYGLFEGARASGVEVVALQSDTIGATKRLTSVLVWLFALVIAYPYIPGSDSDAFKGLSVFFGVLVTLGSSGVVSQVMAGFVLIYSRALRPGDFVQIGDAEGYVMHLGVLSTKLRNRVDQEITLPNSVIVGARVINLSSTRKASGVSLTTSVTIGYDTPWRQVQAMLYMAATRTAGLLPAPAPVVRQLRLQDWYIEYELNVYMTGGMPKYDVLSELHSHVLDVFNEYGVQIMSPNFVLQPADPVLVPKEAWWPPPAAAD